ncbi:SirB2 family protein [Simiduia aestuariiviva]|uniref:Putative membrane protein SirB2 n=1 Tax=Simiduia aestuariiviva TaxID=1510459 RepID=A0A839URY0_9GAMM|nr:SirB2 family protein [Simiduia aestuariiviva]MBB3168145.1 putative membrane protein SirB2 [Simiduia aestuariiviva]
MLALLKHIHMGLALLSITGFFVRGIGRQLDAPWLHSRLTRVAPHIVDTALLVSALGLLYAYQWNPFQQDWLTAKICALLIYIGLGVIAFRLAKTPRHQATAWILALFTAIYIVCVAFTKDPTPFLQ